MYMHSIRLGKKDADYIRNLIAQYWALQFDLEVAYDDIRKECRTVALLLDAYNPDKHSLFRFRKSC